MNREYHSWFSPTLGRDMELLVFGHGGARLIVFPTSQGRFFQWEDQGMNAPLADQLEAGQLQIICVDSVDAESWYAKWKIPADRAHRHVEYDHYILHEVLPWSRERNANPFVITTGASFGAYHAVNFALRHPDVVDRTIGMSGLYDIGGFVNGFSNDDVYFNSPSAYIANEHDPARLAALRHMDIILATGRDDSHRANNEYLSGQLWSKDIWHALRIWDGWAHDWPWWRDMIRLYIGGHD
jgi:esterase/lipase superfamily enzyme